MSSLTIDTYNRSAQAIAAHFEQYANGPDRSKIERAFALAGQNANARAIDIGCGAGKDTDAIMEQCSWYEGIDPSAKLLEIARSQHPGVSYVEADALSYRYPANIDVAFAFASLLHISQDQLSLVFKKLATSMRPGGIVCLTLKEADSYKSELQKDEFGQRLFYFYSPQLVLNLAGPAFEQAYIEHLIVGPKKRPWLCIMLRREP